MRYSRVTKRYLLCNNTCRWTLVPPSQQGDSWYVSLVASAELAEGQELLLCYRDDENNDAFLLHYGFVPPFNPCDSVPLFSSLAAALQWHCEEFVAKDGAQMPGLRGLDDQALAAKYTAAFDAGNAEAAARSSSGSSSSGILLQAGGKAPQHLMRAFAHLADGDRALASRAVARACWQHLAHGSRTPLLHDLAVLAAADGADTRWGAALLHYAGAAAAAGPDVAQALLGERASTFGLGGREEDAGALARALLPQCKLQPRVLARRQVALALEWRAHKKMLLADCLLLHMPTA